MTNSVIGIGLPLTVTAVIKEKAVCCLVFCVRSSIHLSIHLALWFVDSPAAVTITVATLKHIA